MLSCPVPHGTLMPGRPARLVESVKMSARYICTGSAVFSPSFHATVGATGPMITSHWLKARWKSSAMMRRIFCACR
ncbi:hypothetical protein D3C71_1871480 [compost metagenome]